jgi:cytoskeletal protein RodZ
MSETIGQRLKREREARYLTLEKAAADTRIRSVYLQALEADDYSVMPSAAQGRGFLRNYAEYLDLNVDEMIADIQRNPPVIEEVSGPLPQVNLSETEIPPLTESQEETPPPRFLSRLLNRKPRPQSTPEAMDSISDVEPDDRMEVVENQPPAETLPDGGEQASAAGEAKQGLFGRLTSMMRGRDKKQEEAPAVVVESMEEGQPRPESLPNKPADAIMAEIGRQLRERRELISLTIDEVERHTHLRAVFVKALEEGAFDKLPSTVQTRGMLSNYATFLDLDVDAILLRYADALQARRREKYAETPRDKIQTQVNPSIPILRTFIAGDLIFGLMIIVALAALAIWGVGRLVSLQDVEAQPTAPSIVDVLGDIPVPTASEIATFLPVDDPSVATEVVEETQAPPLEETPVEFTANVTVSVFALERVFVRISVDGEIVFEGRMAPRETKVFEAENQVVILTGDGSALRITYNGADLGLMGGVGEVVSRVYLISGVVTPTATIPPTPTNTPPTTPTFTPTLTPTPTATPTVAQ